MLIIYGMQTEASNMAGEPILIVEDNPINAMLVEVLLTTREYETKTAANAEEALIILTTFPAKLIIMDIQLPGIDGLELTRQLKADPQYKNIIIVAVTAYAMKGDREKALAAGCDEYIPKPIDINSFADVITDMLQEK